jgi:hypothetical protein
MNTNKMLLHGLLFFLTLAFGCLSLASSAKCQEKPATPVNSGPAAKFPAAKTQSAGGDSRDADADSESISQNGQVKAEKDSPDAIQKREEWFYKQRASVNGHIPAGARLKAFQHMQRMMAAEGKLILRSDGSYGAATPQSGSTTFPAWTSIGPTPTTGGTFSPVTGRITTIAVDPSDTTGNTVLIGGAQGGIWRSTNAGVTWTAVGDQNASLAMGSIAFAPSSPATVYAGTGEQASIGFDIYYGAGVLKSTNSGQTWTQTCTVAGPTCPFIGPYLDGLNPGFGFFNFGGAHISYVAVNPTNPNLILAGAQFIVEGPQEGVYCSSNGGTTWTNILPDEMSTFVGYASSTVAFVALGNPYGSSSGAPNGNGIYKSTNANSCSATFTPLAGGLPPQSEMGRMDLGISPNYASDSTVYASIADDSTSSSTNLGVWVTTNGGTTWTQTAAPDVCQEQCWYDDVVKVDPNNKDIAFFGGAAVTDSNGNPIWVVRTTTGGTSWPTVIPNQLGTGLPHVDAHAMAFFKLSTGKVRMYLGNDGGIWRTDDAEAATITWTNLNDSLLTLTQFYPSISINPSSSSIAFGGTQDNGSQNYQSGVSWVDNNLCGDGASTAVDANVPSTVYIGCATGYQINASYQNGAAGTFSPAVNGINPADYSDFVPPLASDPSTPNAVYFGTTKVYQSLDAGNTWTPLSGDLVSGSDGDVLTALAIAPANPSVIYAGGNNGAVYVATNVSAGSATFTGIQNNLPPRNVTAIAVDPNDPTGQTAYVAFSGFAYSGADPIGQNINDPQGHIFKTTNAESFVDVSCSVSNCASPAASDLPNIPVNDLVVDPDVPGIIYAATDLGVYVGNCTAMPCTWSTLGTALPNVAVLSLRLYEASRTLVAATHGRGVWEIALNNFAFIGPRIFSLTPTSANAGGAQLTLTVTGTGLTGGTIMFGTTALAATGTSSDTSLSGTLPSTLLTAGSVKVTVAIGNPNPTATSNALPFSVLALTPTLTSINPPSTPVQTPPSPPIANIPIQLTGTNFANGARVLFNGAYSGITSTFNSATSLSATLPSALLGPYGSTNDIQVFNLPPGGGKSTTVTFKVAAPPPANDNFANAINITSVIYSDVRDSSGATTQSSDPTPPPSCVAQYSSAQGNTGGLPNGAYNTIWYQFTPLFSANLEVDTIGSSYDTVLSIWTGAAGSFTSVACNDDINPGLVTQSQLSGVPLTAGTTYYIMVSSFGPPDPNPIALGGKSQLNFVYNNGIAPAPNVTSISPTSASSGSPDLTLTITGSLFLGGASVVFLNSTENTETNLSTTVVSSTQITAVIPASALELPASCTVIVYNAGTSNGSSTPLPFTITVGTYPVPTVTSIFPTSAVAGSLPFQMFVQGSNFAPSAVLNFNGVPIPTTVTSLTYLSGTIPTADIATAGTVPVTVSNPSPGGGPSAPQPFVISQPSVVPSITSVNPTTVTAGFPVNLTINGTGFTQGAFLNVGGTSGDYLPTNFVSSTQLSLSNFGFSTVGTIPVYVVDPAPGGTSGPFNMTATQPPAPTITSISLTSAQTSTDVTLTINGANFEQGANVLFNNQNGLAYSTTVVSTTQITTTLVLGGVAPGTYPITVVNPIPAPTSSNSVNFTVTSPPGPPDFSFTVAAGQASQTVSAGQTATFTNVITVNALNGFTGSVATGCTLPAQATTCSVNPNTLAGGQSANVVVTTTARGLAPVLLLNRKMISWQRVVPLLVLMLLCFVLIRFTRTRRQRLAVGLPLAGVILFLVLQAVGCGGGSTQAPPPPPQTGTPAGTYTITVTGTSASSNTTHTATLQLIVN